MFRSETQSLGAREVRGSESEVGFELRGSYLGNFVANVRRDPPPPTPPPDEDAITDAEGARIFKRPYASFLGGKAGGDVEEICNWNINNLRR